MNMPSLACGVAVERLKSLAYGDIWAYRRCLLVRGYCPSVFSSNYFSLSPVLRCPGAAKAQVQYVWCLRRSALWIMGPGDVRR